MTIESLNQLVINIWKKRFSSIVKNKHFQRLIFANMLWSFTHFAFVLVSGWVVFLLTNSAVKVILLTFFQFSALPIVGLFAGSLIDRVGSRTIMLVSQIIYTVVYLCIAALIYLEILVFWHLATAAVMTGLCWAIDWPARRSILAYVVGENKVSDGYIVDYSIQTLGRVLGSAAAGIITKVLGEVWSYIGFAALSFLAIILITSLIDYKLVSKSNNVSGEAKIPIREVWKHVSRDNIILGVLMVTMCVNFFVVPNRSLFPVFASTVLKGDALYLGYLAVAYSLGGFIGIFLSYWGLVYYKNTNLFIFGSILQSMAFAFFSFSSLLVVSVVILFIAGIGSGYFGVLQSEIILTHTAKHMRNSVLGWLVVAIGLQPLGRLTLGAVTSMAGARLALGGTATIACLLLIVTALRLPGFWQSTPENSSD
jgi:MFS family permease